MKNLLIIFCLSQCFVAYPQPMWKRGNYSIGAQAKDAYGDVYAATKNHNSTTPPSGSNTNWKYVRSTSFVSNDTLAARVTKLEAKVSAPVVSTPPVVTAPVDTLKFPANNVTPPSVNLASYPALTYTTPGISAPGESFSLNAAGTASANTPVVSEYTKSAGASESIILTGDKLTLSSGSDAELKVYNGTLYTATLPTSQNGIAIENYAGVYRMPSATDKKFMVGWLKNSNGYGAPIKINGTLVEWAKDKVVAGAAAHVTGKNLSYNGGTTTAYVYLKNTSGGTVTQATVTAVNPYRIDYTVPAVSNGTYELWIHSGTGGQYNWSKNPNNITVWDGLTWTGGTVTPTLTLNNASAATANTAALNAAITASQDLHRTLTLPAGIVYINDNLVTAYWCRIKGAGGNARSNTLTTEIRFASTYSNDQLFNSSNVEHFQIEDLYINTNGYYENSSNPLMVFRGGKHLVFKNVRILAKKNNIDPQSTSNIPLLDTHLKEYLEIDGCYFIGGQLDLLTTIKGDITNTDFRSVNATVTTMYSWGSRELSVTNCTYGDYNSSDIQETGRGRFITFSGVFGANKNIYIGGNTGSNLGVHPDFSDKNQGEGIMAEGNSSKMSKYPTSATSNTITFSSTGGTFEYEGNFYNRPPMYASTDLFFLFIVEGKGKGDIAEIDVAASGIAGNSFTMKEAWKVVPDATSRIEMIPGTHKLIAYNNTFSQKSYIASAEYLIASAAVEPFGGCSDWTIDGNTFTGYQNAMMNFPTIHSIGYEPNFWIEWKNNTLTGNKYAFNSYLRKDNDHVGPKLMGELIRGNTVSGSLVYDLATQGSPTNSNYAVPLSEYSVVEKNIMNTPMKNIEASGSPTITTGQVHKQVLNSNVVP